MAVTKKGSLASFLIHFHCILILQIEPRITLSTLRDSLPLPSEEWVTVTGCSMSLGLRKILHKQIDIEEDY